MPYDLALAERVRGQLAKQTGLTEKKMFGGVGFMLNGNLCCGLLREGLIVRLAPEATEAALREPGVQPFSVGGRRPMLGWVIVAASALTAPAALRKWVQRGARYAASLPPK